MLLPADTLPFRKPHCRRKFNRTKPNSSIAENRIKREGSGLSYPCVSKEQLEWLKEDVIASGKPTIILTHHPVRPGGYEKGIENYDEVRQVISQLNQDKKRIILFLCGHTHLDGLGWMDDIPQLDINSISCVWMGHEYLYKNYDDETEKNYPYISSVAPYQGPVFACITLSPDIIDVKGYSSDYVGPTPYELGLPMDDRFYECTPSVKDRRIGR